MEAIKIFFTNLFPIQILENEIIATIVFNLSEIIGEFQEKINNQINTDI
jgi:hypothetical protein